MEKEIWKKPVKPCAIGGEALIEGVMMRGKDKIASAVRLGDGSINLSSRPYTPITKRNKLFGLPIIRGGISLFDSMIVGMKEMMDSAELVDFEEEEPSKFDNFLERVFGDKLMTVVLYFSVIIAMGFGILLFMILPNFIADIIGIDKTNNAGSVISHLIEGVLRIVIFFGYIFLVSKVKDIKRVFQYHGAEHKTIYTYESGEELTVENAKKHTRFHPRCGTAFLFVVMIISIILFSFTGWHSRIVNILIRLALLPVVAGVSYEIIKFAGKSSSKIMRMAVYPGLMLQRLTTQEPDNEQLECAIVAMKCVLGESLEGFNIASDDNEAGEDVTSADSDETEAESTLDDKTDKADVSDEAEEVTK